MQNRMKLSVYIVFALSGLVLGICLVVIGGCEYASIAINRHLFQFVEIITLLKAVPGPARVPIMKI